MNDTFPSYAAQRSCRAQTSEACANVHVHAPGLCMSLGVQEMAPVARCGR
jgi:hypothetical protein